MNTSMLKTIGLSAFALSLSNVQAVNVFIVSDNPTDPLISFVTTNFSNVDSVTTDSYATGAPATTGSDIVIFSRNTNSGNYSNNVTEIDSWNSLPNNMLLMSSFMLRDVRLGWTDNGDLPQPSSAGNETTLVVPADPLFAGLSGTSVDLYNVDGASGNIDRVGGTGGVGGGTILATIAGNNAIARYPSGSALADITPGGFTTTQITHGGDRIFMSLHVGSGGIDPSLTSDGQIVLTNALKEMGLNAVPEPSSALFGLLSAGLLIRRRR
ncbi:MAG: PEP-CTERM sorting domain-containing protein [Verrucomicrobiaceae bacterium]